MAKLFYVIGASGVGKDSLLNYARQHMPTSGSTVFAHRYITRPVEAGGENHIALSHEEFEQRAQQHCFAMHWHSHGNGYGIGSEINQWLAQGLNVVVNGSRVYFSHAAERYPTIVPVLITADKEQLSARLIKRGRENHADIERRLQASEFIESRVDHPALVVIENNVELAAAGDALVKLLTSGDPQPTKIKKVKA